LISRVDYQTDIAASQKYLASSGKKARLIMFDQMQKLSEQQEYERANEIKKRIKSLDILHQEQSFNNALTSVDLFTCVSKINKTGACILSIRNGRIRGTKTHYLQGNELKSIDNLLQSLIFSYYQNSFSLPEKILLAPKPKDVSLIRQAVYLKFNKKIMVTTTVNSSNRQIVKLAKYNANQVIDNKVKQSEKYLYGITNIASSLGLKKKHLTIEGYDISHQGGHYAVGSSVRFSIRGPEKSEYRLFNIPQDLSGNDIGSMKYVLERRISKSDVKPLPDIILIDGGQAQLNAALDIFSDMLKKYPIILSIVKGAKRVRSTETILSKNGIIEMSKENPGFLLLQKIRDESHRFAIKNNRKKKSLSLKKSKIDKIKGIGSTKRQLLFKEFKTIDNLKKTSYEDLIKVPGIGKKLASVIKNNI
jgi:excinuclease ABC subunit C